MDDDYIIIVVIIITVIVDVVSYHDIVDYVLPRTSYVLNIRD